MHKKGTNDFSHICIFDKNQVNCDKGDISKIQRTLPILDFENDLPMDVSAPKSELVSTFCYSTDIERCLSNAPYPLRWQISASKEH
jgi:hypothetical protein